MSLAKRKVTLTSSDGESFEVRVPVALEFLPVKQMIEDDCTVNTIPLYNVTGKILAKVIEYCKKHVKYRPSEVCRYNAAAVEEELKEWDAEFVKVDHGTLFYLVLAAYYLNIKGLLDLTCQTAADIIRGFTPEEIRKFFNVKEEFTPEEEEEVRRENRWAFE